MRVAPFRALTQFPTTKRGHFRNRRNECRPFQGIDTVREHQRRSIQFFVEMSVAPIQGLNTRVVTTSTT